MPVRNREYWEGKIARNKTRDFSTLFALKKLGWKILVIWECEIRTGADLERRLKRFLGR